ncbi:MAG TPA: hypothetical protein VFJ24_12385 [Gaiellales bacterium]|nr:hypothetical protein [Gaiellales bacterium]
MAQRSFAAAAELGASEAATARPILHDNGDRIAALEQRADQHQAARRVPEAQ